MFSFRPILFILSLAGCAFSQRLYNEGNDRKAAEALAISQQVLSGQIWEKALTNLDELYKLRQQMVFDSTQAILRSEWNTWESWADVKATFDRLPAAPDPPSDAAVKRRIEALKDSRAATEVQLDQLRAKLLEHRTVDQVRMIGLWLERIGAAKPVIDRAVKLEEDPAAVKANLAAADAAKNTLDSLTTLFRNFNVEIPTQNATSLFLENQIRLLDLEQAHILRLGAIQDRLQIEMVRVESLRKRGNVLLDKVLAKYPDLTIKESFAKAKTDNPEFVEEMVSALYHVAACQARADLPGRLTDHRESLELRAQGIRRDAANAGLYERTIVNGIQRLSSYHKGGIRPQNAAALIHSLAMLGLIPAIATR